MSSFQLLNPLQGVDFFSMLMDDILSGGFWDNVLIPGMFESWFHILCPLSRNNHIQNTLFFLQDIQIAASGGFAYGLSGSGFITPRRGSPAPDSNALLIFGLNKWCCAARRGK
jgi:hypothetical protein